MEGGDDDDGDGVDSDDDNDHYDDDDDDKCPRPSCSALSTTSPQTDLAGL